MYLKVAKSINKVKPYIYNPEEYDLIIAPVNDTHYCFVSFPIPTYYGGSAKENFKILNKKIDLGSLNENEVFWWVEKLIHMWRVKYDLQCVMADLQEVQYSSDECIITILLHRQDDISKIVEKQLSEMTTMLEGKWIMKFKYLEK